MPASVHLYGETLSSQSKKTEYIRGRMAALDNLEILKEQLNADEQHDFNKFNERIYQEVFRRDYTPTWPEKWVEKLLLFRPDQSKTDNFSKILEHFETRQELIETVDEVYRMLFERDNPFFKLMDTFSSLRIYESVWDQGRKSEKGLIANIPGMKLKDGSNRVGWVFTWTNDADIFFTKLIG